MTKNVWKCLKKAENGCSERKWLKMAGVTKKCCRWLEMAKHTRKWLQMSGLAEIGWKGMEMAGNGREMAINSLKFLEMAGKG